MEYLVLKNYQHLGTDKASTRKLKHLVHGMEFKTQSQLSNTTHEEGQDEVLVIQKSVHRAGPQEKLSSPRVFSFLSELQVQHQLQNTQGAPTCSRFCQEGGGCCGLSAQLWQPKHRHREQESWLQVPVTPSGAKCICCSRRMLSGQGTFPCLGSSIMKLRLGPLCHQRGQEGT